MNFSLNEVVEFIKRISEPEVGIELVHPNAKMPIKAHDNDSGFDLFCLDDLIIYPFNRLLVSTGVKVKLPVNFEAQIRPKSGRAINEGLTVLNTPGTVDEGFSGEVKVALANFSEKKIIIESGSKIAQMVVSYVPRAKLSLVDKVVTSGRGEGGFGSTGLV